MFEQFSASSGKAKILNILFILFNFLAWVACCVGFGGVLATSKTDDLLGGEVKLDWYWNHMIVTATGDRLNFDDDMCDDDVSADCGKCRSGGKGFLAMQVFAFLGLTVVLALSIIRVVGVQISALEPTRKVLFWELFLTGLNTLWFFLSVCIWGGTCFHELMKKDNTQVAGTGFAFTICCFFFLIFNLVIIYFVRGDSSAHLGSSSGSDYTSENGSGGDSNTTNYSPPASYQYNADPATAAYAGAYNTDVMPSAQVENNNL